MPSPLGLRLARMLGPACGPAAQRLASWDVFWRSALVAFGLIGALSTQFLFQAGLYDAWPLADIVRGWLEHMLELMIVGSCIFAAVAAGAALPAATGARRHALVLAALALGAIAGEQLLLVWLPLPVGVSHGGVLFAKVIRWVVIGGLAYAVFTYLRRAEHAAARAHESELHRLQLERQADEAQLESLRAQIEPHFLFNTLANVQRLYQTDPASGRRMLASFVAYLRAALPQMRRDETTLSAELELSRAYLDVLQVRMGARLRVSIEVPEALGALAFPPLALCTLTENAVKHGLNPLPDGGSIRIAARLKESLLEVEVADTGAGLRQASGSGSGLANLRARLTALYGDSASLGIAGNLPHGIRATILVPARRAGA